jgi:hypothetical protein
MANLFGQMAHIIKGRLKKIYLMERDYIVGLMELFMKEHGN